MRAPYFADERSALYLGDCREVLAELDACSIDAVVTDPPYGLEFMGHDWDKLEDGLADRGMWKGRRGRGGSKIGDGSAPGGARVAFGMKRHSYKRCRTCGKRSFSSSPCVCASPDWQIEHTAGAPSGAIRAQRWHETWAREAYRVLKPGGHLLAFGAPRTFHRLTAALEDAGFDIRDCLMWLYGSGFPKHASALKPAWEPILLARRPLEGSVARNVAAHGTGALNIDACRIPGPVEADGTPGNGQIGSDAAGRWPANVVFDEVAAAALDAQAGERRVSRGELRRGASIGYGGSAGSHTPGVGYGDSGGASRFFYCAKASKAEREAGLEGLPAVAPTTNKWMDRHYYPDGRVVETRARRNTHPTVKPLALMRWLVRLATPAGGLVLDPFTGSGTTRLAALAEGRRFVGVELNEEYLAIALARRVQADLGMEGVI